jgi:hypothetical protein
VTRPIRTRDMSAGRVTLDDGERAVRLVGLVSQADRDAAGPAGDMPVSMTQPLVRAGEVPQSSPQESRYAPSVTRPRRSVGTRGSGMFGAHDVVDLNDVDDQAVPSAEDTTHRETPRQPTAAGPTAPQGAARLANPNRLITG